LLIDNKHHFANRKPTKLRQKELAFSKKKRLFLPFQIIMIKLFGFSPLSVSQWATHQPPPPRWMNQLLKAKVTGPLVEKLFDRVTSREIFILPPRAGGCFCSYARFLGGVARWADGITISFVVSLSREGRGIRTYSCL
jgi:hypothetical protein